MSVLDETPLPLMDPFDALLRAKKCIEDFRAYYIYDNHLVGREQDNDEVRHADTVLAEIDAAFAAKRRQNVLDATQGFRKDGWPLCPSCGEDEAYSLAIPADPVKLDGCYACGWRAKEDK